MNDKNNLVFYGCLLLFSIATTLGCEDRYAWDSALFFENDDDTTFLYVHIEALGKILKNEQQLGSKNVIEVSSELKNIIQNSGNATTTRQELLEDLQFNDFFRVNSINGVDNYIEFIKENFGRDFEKLDVLNQPCSLFQLFDKNFVEPINDNYTFDLTLSFIFKDKKCSDPFQVSLCLCLDETTEERYYRVDKEKIECDDNLKMYDVITGNSAKTPPQLSGTTTTTTVATTPETSSSAGASDRAGRLHLYRKFFQWLPFALYIQYMMQQL
jgi:hypothetical protein